MRSSPYIASRRSGLHRSFIVPAPSLIGYTRQRVNQILKDWELEAIVEQQYGRLLLLDQSRLERMDEQ